MKTLKVRGWEINTGIANSTYFDFMGIGVKTTRLMGGWCVHFGVSDLLIIFVAWYK